MNAKACSANAFGDTYLAQALDDTAAKYDSNWSEQVTGNAYDGGCTLTSTPGATATFTGRWANFGWVAQKGPKGGLARILVDGKVKATVNLYAAKPVHRALVFKTGFAGTGGHTVRIIDASQAGSARSQVISDAFVQLASTG